MRLDKRSSPLRRWILVLLAGLLSVTVFASPHSGANAEPRFGIKSDSVPLNATGQDDSRSVVVGLQVKNIYDLSLSNQSFQADGWYWMSWNQDVQATLERLDLKPSEILEFSNEIEPGQYSYSEVISGTQIDQADGRHFLEVKFSGKFYINNVNQRLAPFDSQRIEIGLEVKPQALTKGIDRVTIVPASLEQFPMAGEFATVSGFVLADTQWSRQNVQYIEPVLDSKRIEQSISDYSRITAVFTYEPVPLTIFLKWLLPLIAVMAIVILSPSIDGTLGDVRLAIPSAALLTLVVLHDSYKANFPPSPFLTYLDEIYSYSYLCCFAIFLLFLVGTNAHSRSSEEDRETVKMRVDRIDMIVQISCSAGLVLVAIVGWFS